MKEARKLLVVPASTPTSSAHRWCSTGASHASNQLLPYIDGLRQYLRRCLSNQRKKTVSFTLHFWVGIGMAVRIIVGITIVAYFMHLPLILHLWLGVRIVVAGLVHLP